MSKLTRNQKKYYDNYTEVISKIDAAVECASERQAIKISESVSSETSKLSSVSASGDEAVESLVSVVQQIGNQFNTLAILANQYGSEIEPLYEEVQTQLKEIKTQEDEYKNICNDGPDDQSDKYYKTINNEKKFQKELYDTDVKMWNDKLDKYESLLQSMCNNVDSIISKLSAVNSASIIDVAVNGFGFISSSENVFDNQFESSETTMGTNLLLEDIKYMQTRYADTDIWYAIIPKELQPKLGISFNSNGKVSDKAPSVLAQEFGAKLAINFSLTGVGYTLDRRKAYMGGGAGILYDGKNLVTLLNNKRDTTLYMDKDGNLGFFYNDPQKNGGKSAKQMIEQLQPKWAAKTFFPIAVDGQYVDENKDPNIGGRSVNPRTFIGQTANGDYFVGVSTGRVKGKQKGLTLKEVYDFSQSVTGENIKFLMNGDGGGSSSFVYDGKKLNPNTDSSERPRPDIIYWSA